MVDTPGFGDGVDNTGCWEPIIQYVDQQFNMFLEAETQVTTSTSYNIYISTISTYLQYLHGNITINHLLCNCVSDPGRDICLCAGLFNLSLMVA